MSFKSFIEENKDLAVSEMASPLLEGHAKTAPSGILQDILTKTSILKKSKRLRRFFTQPRLIPLGDATVYVEEDDFEHALMHAHRYFAKNSKSFSFKDIQWSCVMKRSFEDLKSTTNPKQAENLLSHRKKKRELLEYTGYKFFIIKQEQFIDISSKSLSAETPESKKFLLFDKREDTVYLKLISLLDGSEERSREEIYNLSLRLGIAIKKKTVKQILLLPNIWIKAGVIDKKTESLTQRFNLSITDNHCKVYLSIDAKLFKEKPLRAEEIQSFLEGQGIIYGILGEEIEEYVTTQDFSKKHLIAHADEAVPCKDASIENIAFNKAKEKIEEEKQKTTIDYREFTAFISVKKGDVIAFKHEVEEGKKGKNIYGHEISVPKARNIRFLGGKNTEFLEDEKTLVAAMNGNLHRDANGFWSVDNLLRVESVGPETGNISHLGSILVAGSVVDGYSIVCSGDLHVMHSVGASRLEAGGNIVVSRGVNGKNVGELISHFANVRTKFLSDCAVIADGFVRVRELISNCQVIAGQKIEVYSSKGSIWGGSLSATQLIFTPNLGSVSGRKTFVEVGIPFAIRKEIYETEKHADGLRQQLSALKKEIKKTNLSKPKNTENTTELEEFNSLKHGLSDAENTLNMLRNSKALIHNDCRVVVPKITYAAVTIQCNSFKITNRKYRNANIYRADLENMNTLVNEPYFFTDKDAIL